MGIFSNEAFQLENPSALLRYELDPSAVNVINASPAANDLSTTASFTSLNTQGLADTTNWSTDTFKTLLSVSEPGELVGYVGPTVATAGDVHTVEITVDGVVSTIAMTTTSNTRRPALLAMGPTQGASFTTALNATALVAPSMSTNKRQIVFTGFNNVAVPTWHLVGMFKPPLLVWKNSLLVRAKNSVAITNSTATAFSALIYRLKGGVT